MAKKAAPADPSVALLRRVQALWTGASTEDSEVILKDITDLLGAAPESTVDESDADDKNG